MSDTPPDETAKFILDNMKGTEFGGFSFVNPEFGLDDNDEMMIPDETNIGRKNWSVKFVEGTKDFGCYTIL